MWNCSRMKISRYLLMVLLAAFLLFDLYAAADSPAVQDCPGGALPVQSVLSARAADHLLPIRVPEKVLVRENASQSWERWNKRESEHVVFLLIFSIVFSLLLLSRTGMSRFIPESGNLPYIRILYYIHRKDGKGPEKHFIS